MSGNKSRKKSPAQGLIALADSEVDLKRLLQKGNGSPAARNDEEHVYENIFLFWPNITGYMRIVLVLGSLYYMPLHLRTCTLLFIISCLLDALDGYSARYFSQSTRFGAVLMSHISHSVSKLQSSRS